MIEINRKTASGSYKLEEIFVGLKNVEILRELFNTQKELDDVFENTQVIVEKKDHYMFVKNDDASIVVGLEHLQNSDQKILYLDIVHELVHVKQQREGHDLYDKSYAYVDRPTEIEAYEITVREAKRIGMTNMEILDYLQVEWVSSEDHRRLASRLGIN